MALVRVRIAGVEKNVSEALAEAADLKVLKDEPIRRPDGTLRPDERVRKPAKKAASKTTADTKSAVKKAAEPAEAAEEAN